MLSIYIPEAKWFVTESMPLSANNHVQCAFHTHIFLPKLSTENKRSSDRETKSLCTSQVGSSHSYAAAHRDSYRIMEWFELEEMPEGRLVQPRAVHRTPQLHQRSEPSPCPWVPVEMGTTTSLGSLIPFFFSIFWKLNCLIVFFLLCNRKLVV